MEPVTKLSDFLSELNDVNSVSATLGAQLNPQNASAFASSLLNSLIVDP